VAQSKRAKGPSKVKNKTKATLVFLPPLLWAMLKIRQWVLSEQECTSCNIENIQYILNVKQVKC
jgi:hypothetical protein